MVQSPIVTLKSGVRVANFSSPHPFTFDDGTVLPACDPERARALMLNSEEVETRRERWADIELRFVLSFSVWQAISELERRNDVDIVLVPFPVMEAVKADGQAVGKCRVCRVADRVAKTIHADRFCW